MNRDADIARKIIDKAREFKSNSMSKDKLLKDLLDNPSKAQNDQVYDGVPGREAALAKWKARGAWAPDDVVDDAMLL